MMNIPNRRNAKMEASDTLARSSSGLMRAAEFTERGGWSEARGLRYISRSPHGNDPHPRCANAQPQECLALHSAQPTGGDHGPFRLGKIIARLRHPLRGGPAPLRRIALRLRAPVPAADGVAGRGPHRGPESR